MAKWDFSCRDNGGKYHYYIITANNKPDAIDKGIKKVKKNGGEGFYTWNCSLKSC